jgi:hypothetical protein
VTAVFRVTCTLALGFFLFSAGPAVGATQIGDDSAAAIECAGPNFTAVQGSTVGPPVYTVPSGGGVVTSWKHVAPGSAGTLQLKMFRPAGAGKYLVVGESSAEPVAAGPNAFATRIPVRAGDLVGLRSSGAHCAFSGAAGDAIVGHGDAPSDPAPSGSTYTPAMGVPQFRLAVAAVVEADYDGDGFGDESQDACPTNASTQGGCPKVTTTPPRRGGPRQPPAPPPPPPPGLLVGNCANVQNGSAAGNTLRGTIAGDRLVGLRGDDVLTGSAGNDCLDGGPGNDRLSGASGRDRLRGSSGNDSLRGGSGRDRLDGGSGRNKISAGSGNDVINAVNGRRERVNCGAGRDRVAADDRDRLVRCERVRRLK